MNKTHYTISQVLAMRQQFRDVLALVVADMFHLHKVGALKKRPTQTYELPISKDECEQFTVIFSGCVLSDLLGGKDEQSAHNASPKVTAAVWIQTKPWGLTLTEADLEAGVEKTLESEMFLRVADSFLEHVVAGMVRGWYYHGLADRIATWVEEKNFEAIADRFNGMVDVSWSETGYNTQLLVPAAGTGELQVARLNNCFNALASDAVTTDEYRAKCRQLTHAYVIILITLGFVEEGFTWIMF